MKEIEQYLKEYDLEKSVFNVSANFTLQPKKEYLDFLFKNDSKAINYKNFLVEVNECFYNKYCHVYKPKFTEEERKKLNKIAKILITTDLLDENIKLICEIDEYGYAKTKFYSLPKKNKSNDYSIFIIPDEIIKIKGINYENELDEYNKTKKITR